MIHQYKLNGYNIVIDVYSGSIHIVDDVAYDVIAAYEGNTREQIVAQVLPAHEKNGVTEADILMCIDDVDALKKEEKLSKFNISKTQVYVKIMK